jgi:ParB family chromosome partitioning protein
MGGQLDMGHARALLALPTAQQDGGGFARCRARMSVRETEKLVHQLRPSQPAWWQTQCAVRAIRISRASRRTLAESLGAKVTIDAKASGAGKLTIAYASLEQLDGILARLSRA